MNHMLIIVYFYLSIMAYSYQAGILMMHGVYAYHYPFKTRAFKTVNAHISIAVGFPCWLGGPPLDANESSLLNGPSDYYTLFHPPAQILFFF